MGEFPLALLAMRRLAATLLILLVAWGTARATLEAVRPPAPASRLNAQVTASPPVERLARRVLLVVVDGLRADIANDPRRMPHFSAALKAHTSGNVLAGPITMTSSAVLAYGTGQPGSLDQILENLHPPLVNTNSWLENAHQAGLHLMAVGDAAWAHLYGRWLDEFRPDPDGVAIEADFNRQTFENARELAAKWPDFLVVHCVTPDHQGHAYGVASTKYAEHIRAFDRTLFDWLGSLDAAWTVIVTSDHGAADSGTHGTDTDVQRTCPLFAFGPGIRPNLHWARAFDQTELAGLFAALLGVSTAAQAQGITPIEWLDLPPLVQRKLACSEVARVQTLAAELAPSDVDRRSWPARRCCDAAPQNQTCTTEARALSASYAAKLGRTQGIDSTRSWPWVALVVLAASLAVFVTFAKRALAPMALFGLWLLVSLGLTYGVERLPGVAPNIVRALLFVVVNGGLLLACIRFKTSAALAARHPALALSLVPGWLLVSYTTNTQIEAYVTVIVFTGLLLTLRETALGPPKRLPPLFQKGNAPELVLALASILLLALSGTKPSDICPAILAKSNFVALSVAGALLTLGLLVLLRQEPVERTGSVRQPPLTVAALGIALLSLMLRHYSVAAFGRWAIIATGIGALAACRRGRTRWAFVLGIASYGWVSRDFEWLAFAPSLILADIIGRVCARAHDFGFGVTSRKFAGTLVLVTFLFALCTLQRIGLQGGLQLTTLDFAAGSFGDAHVAVWLAATCLVYKFVVAQVLLVGIAIRRMPAKEQSHVLLGLGAAHLARGVALLLMLLTCGHSYWTAFRVVADLPFAMVGVVIAGLAGANSKILSSKSRAVWLPRVD